MKRTQQILLVVIMMFVAVSGVYRYLPCFKEVFISGREPYENCAEAGSEPKGAIGEASSKLVVLPSPETIRSSGTGEIAVSNQVTTPYGEAPHILSHFPKDHPSSLKPVLRWEKADDAVVYEVQLAKDGTVFQTDGYVFINGYHAVLPDDYAADHFEFRVRALNLDRVPMTPFSAWETVYVDPQMPSLQRPVPTNRFNEGIGTTLLYPVYNWIPVHGARNYEVEILSRLPERPDQRADAAITLGRGKATGFDWYDDTKRVASYPLYWRVRALDDEGQPIGVFSEPQKMVINPSDHWEVATLGDSIYHGGGNLSYSPSDWEYSFQHYLKFDSINLAQSGDTSGATLARFDDDVLPFHPHYLIIMTGTNSLRAGVDPDDVISDLAAIKEKCEQNGICPIFMTLPPINPKNIARAFNEPTAEDWKERFAAVNAYIRTQIHIDLAGKIPEGVDLPTELGLDGIHLDPPGKKLMAEAVNEQWEKVLAQFAEK